MTSRSETFSACSRSNVSPASTVTVMETVNEFLLAKARAQRSDRYLRQLRVSLGSFAKGRARAPLAVEIEGDDLEVPIELKAGMTFILKPQVRPTEGKGRASVGDTVTVTENGARPGSANICGGRE